MGFSTKVSFIYKNKKFIGRICNVLENDTYEVLTTGEDGALYVVKGSQMKIEK